MKIKYIGTAAAEAIPALFCHCDLCKRARELGGKNIRGRSGAVINDKLIVDFPPDIYFQSLKFNIDLGSIKDMVITHTHIDHFAANELLFRDTAYYAHLPQDSKPISIYGNKNVLYELSSAMQKEFGVIDKNFAAYTEAKPFEPFYAGDIKVIPLLARHTPREKCLIYIFEHSGKRFLYGNDTGYLPDEDFEFIKGLHLDLVSLDCCFGNMKEGSNHMGIPDNLEVKNRLEELGCADGNTKFIITHFSHNNGMLHEELEQAAEKYGFITAYDGFELII